MAGSEIVSGSACYVDRDDILGYFPLKLTVLIPFVRRLVPSILPVDTLAYCDTYFYCR